MKDNQRITPSDFKKKFLPWSKWQLATLSRKIGAKDYTPLEEYRKTNMIKEIAEYCSVEAAKNIRFDLTRPAVEC
jgi:hypothetical protein